MQNGNIIEDEQIQVISPPQNSNNSENNGESCASACLHECSGIHNCDGNKSNSCNCGLSNRRKPKKKVTVKNRSGNWRKHLNLCRSPSNESIADINTSQINSKNVRRCASTGNSINNNGTCGNSGTPGNSGNSGNNAEELLHTGPPSRGSPLSEQALAHELREGLAMSHVAPYGRANLPTASTSGPILSNSTAARRTTRNSPLCPCFSPNDSDEESDRATVSMPWFLAPQFVAAAREWRRTRSAQQESQLQQQSPQEMQMNTVPDMVAIANAPYYWGVMDRYEAERLLNDKPEGTFLLRDSAQMEYLFSVSFRRYQRTLHARIEQLDHRFSFDSYDSNVFSAGTVIQLIEHYKDPAQCLFFEPKLTAPFNRSFVFPLQHLCRAAVNTNLEYGDINELMLPKKFKEFLKEYHYKQPVRVTNLE